MAREIPKGYQPQEIEPKWADYWVAEALFRAELAAAEYAGGFILALCGARDDEVDVGDRGGEGRPSMEKS